MTDIQTKLISLQDVKYAEFNRSLVPGVPADRMIGVRVPLLRKMAKQLDKAEAERFISVLPHEYYEEYLLHGFIIERIKDFDRCMDEIERFLPYVDNWAVCDTVTPPVFGKDLPRLCGYIESWLASDRTYTVRYAIRMLMRFFLDGEFSPEYPEAVAAVSSDDYYVNMMRAWYFATALAKRYDDILPYLTERRLDIWTHNKTLQKAKESYRISTEQKAFLASLKI